MPCIYQRKHNKIQAPRVNYLRWQEHAHYYDADTGLLNQAYSLYNVYRLYTSIYIHRTFSETIIAHYGKQGILTVKREENTLISNCLCDGTIGLRPTKPTEAEEE